MDKAASFAALEARAFAARTSLSAVCAKAQVSPTTITRWRADPGIMKARTLGKLEDALAKIEVERREALQEIKEGERV